MQRFFVSIELLCDICGRAGVFRHEDQFFQTPRRAARAAGWTLRRGKTGDRCPVRTGEQSETGTGPAALPFTPGAKPSPPPPPPSPGLGMPGGAQLPPLAAPCSAERTRRFWPRHCLVAISVASDDSFLRQSLSRLCLHQSTTTHLLFFSRPFFLLLFSSSYLVFGF